MQVLRLSVEAECWGWVLRLSVEAECWGWVLRLSVEAECVKYKLSIIMPELTVLVLTWAHTCWPSEVAAVFIDDVTSKTAWWSRLSV